MAISSSSSASRAASLAPGFRFHPTDEELVRYYLRRKICGKPFRFDAISVIDIYKVEPWDLPGKSRLRSRDLEWYFFSVLDRKYGNASRTNRATERGYWKTTGKDRAVWHRSKVVGMKKTLVYHSGRAPRGDRTNWVMHEYRLVDEDLEKRGILQDALVLCRVFQKSGSGPKNGEQYGAPFIEEEWEDDEFEIFPEEALAEEVVVSNGACLDISDLEQILGTSIPSGGAPLPLNLSPGDNISFSENQSEQPDKPDSLNMPMQNNMVAKSLEYQNNVEPRNDNIGDVDFLLDEPFLDSTDNYDNKGFLEASDDMLEEYLAFFDADDGTSQHMAFDLSDMIGNDNFIPEEPLFAPEIMNGGAQLLSMPSNQLLGGRVDDVTSSSKQEPVKFESESQYQIVKRANQMLKSIPAPPAFASEFPAKGAALRLNSAFRSSLIAASLVQIRNTTSSVKTKWPLGKRRDVNIVLSFGMSRSGGSSGIWGSTVGLLSGMAGSAISRALFYFLFLWVLILSVSFKIGSFVCAR